MVQKLKNYVHLLQAIAANIRYGFPARHATVIGVTGTDGKTTTTSMIYHILKSAGKNVAMITSVGAYIGDNVYDIGFHVTTPSPFGLQYFLRKAVDAGCTHIVLETTSHALDQYRVWGIPYKIGVLTNITHEHLDYHKTYEEYVKTKLKLLQRSDIAIVNMDDESYAYVERNLSGTFRIGSQIKSNPSSVSEVVHLNKEKNRVLPLAFPANYFNSIAKLSKNNPSMFTRSEVKSIRGMPSLVSPDYIKKLLSYALINDQADFTPKKYPFTSHLLGIFNQYNSLAAFAACKALGISDADIRNGISGFTPPPGRQEIVYDKDFRVMIDFAHTPNAFLKILPEVKKITKGRLIHVFGAAGKRDFTKRPEMGAASDQYADIIILTAEDPRDEKVEEICSQIELGIKKKDVRKKQKTLFHIPNRREAITFALRSAKKGDTVLLTGKSHEKSMNMGHGEEPWDEYGEVHKSLELIHDS